MTFPVYGPYCYVFQIWINGTGTGTRNGIQTDLTEIRDWYHIPKDSVLKRK